MSCTVLILGGTGMLGNAVGKYFLENTEHDVYLTARDLALAYGPRNHWIGYDPTGKTEHYDLLKDVFAEMPRTPDYVINCVGTIKPFMDKNPADGIFLNSLLPHQLAETCNALGVRLISITTDCVYSGSKGGYVESDLHDALDAYGKSKSLGETKEGMVIRTSILGEEIHKNASLVAWAKSQAGKAVSGFKNHFWNGVTTKQFAKICEQIIDENLHENGLFHLPADVVSKFELLGLLNKRFDLNLTINPVDAKENCDRSLCSEKHLTTKIKIPPIETQIAEM